MIRVGVDEEMDDDDDNDELMRMRMMIVIIEKADAANCSKSTMKLS